MAENNFYDDEDIITMTGDNGEEIEFVELLDIPLDGKYYSVMQPLKPMEGVPEDSVIVFRVEPKGEEAVYTVELDDNVVNKVLDEFEKAYEEAQEEENN